MYADRIYYNYIKIQYIVNEGHKYILYSIWRNISKKCINIYLIFVKIENIDYGRKKKKGKKEDIFNISDILIFSTMHIFINDLIICVAHIALIVFIESHKYIYILLVFSLVI